MILTASNPRIDVYSSGTLIESISFPLPSLYSEEWQDVKIEHSYINADTESPTLTEIDYTIGTMGNWSMYWKQLPKEKILALQRLVVEYPTLSKWLIPSIDMGSRAFEINIKNNPLKLVRPAGGMNVYGYKDITLICRTKNMQPTPNLIDAYPNGTNQAQYVRTYGFLNNQSIKFLNTV